MKPTININIDKLIENFTVVGQTAESKETIKQVITEVLLTAVNDVNLGELEVKNDSIANNAEPISANEKTTNLKLECLRLATQKSCGDILNQAKEYFTWLNG